MDVVHEMQILKMTDFRTKPAGSQRRARRSTFDPRCRLSLWLLLTAALVPTGCAYRMAQGPEPDKAMYVPAKFVSGHAMRRLPGGELSKLSKNLSRTPAQDMLKPLSLDSHAMRRLPPEKEFIKPSKNLSRTPAQDVLKSLSLDSAALETAFDLHELRDVLFSVKGSYHAFPAYWPLPRGYLSSPFGEKRGKVRRHYGADLVAPRHTPVFALADGTVSIAGTRRGYGRLLEIHHADGYTTRYAHLGRMQVGVGDHVHGGQQIGLVGSSGNATTNLLHFELRYEKQALDPIPYLLAPHEIPSLCQASCACGDCAPAILKADASG